jgi:hypothetical protein
MDFQDEERALPTPPYLKVRVATLISVKANCSIICFGSFASHDRSLALPSIEHIHYPCSRLRLSVS